MRQPARILLLVLVLALVTASCNRGGAEETTTTLAEVTTTAVASADPSTTTTDPAQPVTSSSTTTSTSTVPGAISEPEWVIAERIEGEEGATVVVLLDSESYERLTDIDLQNIVEDTIELFPPIYEVHIVDSQEAADVVLSDVVDTNDQAILEGHYFARLEEGFRIVFVGPFSDFGITILGS